MCIHQPLFFPSDLVDYVAQNSLIFFHWRGMFIFLPSQFIHCLWWWPREYSRNDTAPASGPLLLPLHGKRSWATTWAAWLLCRKGDVESTRGPGKLRLPTSLSRHWAHEMGHPEACRPAHPPAKYLSNPSGCHVEQKNCIPEPWSNSCPPNCEI